MYCVVCLKNRARDFFCTYCQPKVETLFKPGQLSVAKEDKEDFLSLRLENQWNVIYLTNKRLGKLLKLSEIRNGVLTGIAVLEFHLGRIICEYTEMVLLGHQQLEIPPAPKEDNVGRDYHQYKTMHGGIL